MCQTTRGGRRAAVLADTGRPIRMPAALADAIYPRYRALVLVGAYGGLRIGELSWLGCAGAASTCCAGR